MVGVIVDRYPFDAELFHLLLHAGLSRRSRNPVSVHIEETGEVCRTVGIEKFVTDHTVPNKKTRAEEAAEAHQPSGPDWAPTDEEAVLADRNVSDPETAAHEEGMNKRGATQRGEGRLT